MAMAANCARRTLRVALAATKTQLCRRSSSALASNANDFSGLTSCGPTIASRISAHKLSLSFNRLPKQLAGAQMSLMPLYSVTASALFTSLLSVHNNKWGCLSEGEGIWLMRMPDKDLNAWTVFNFWFASLEV